MKLRQIFEPKPHTWGLRGDPYLWEELQSQLGELQMPESAETLSEWLYCAYYALTKRPLANGEPFVVERYKHGGMSSGGISPKFWLETGMPLLIGRYVPPV